MIINSNTTIVSINQKKENIESIIESNSNTTIVSINRGRYPGFGLSVTNSNTTIVSINQDTNTMRFTLGSDSNTTIVSINRRWIRKSTPYKKIQIQLLFLLII